MSPGDKYGRLEIVRLISKRYVNKGGSWICRCECGNERVLPESTIVELSSCGCSRWSHVTTHKLSKTPEHSTWTHIKQRCNNPNNDGFYLYGGRGIKVCQRWMDSFEAFYHDMGERPSSRHQIDRIDSNGNYEPGNCRWATSAEQLRNTRRTRLLTFNGRTQCLADWATEVRIDKRTLQHRIVKFGWSVDEALTTPAVSNYIRRVSPCR